MIAFISTQKTVVAKNPLALAMGEFQLRLKKDKILDIQIKPIHYRNFINIEAYQGMSEYYNEVSNFLISIQYKDILNFRQKQEEFNLSVLNLDENILNLKEKYKSQNLQKVYDTFSHVFKFVDSDFVNKQINKIKENKSFQRFKILYIRYDKDNNKIHFERKDFKTYIQGKRRYFSDDRSDYEITSFAKVKKCLEQQVLLPFSNNDLLTTVEQLPWLSFNKKAFLKSIDLDSLLEQSKSIKSIKNF